MYFPLLFLFLFKIDCLNSTVYDDGMDVFTFIKEIVSFLCVSENDFN